MRDYAKIACTIWRSRKFQQLGADNDAKLLYFYLHTCPHVNSVGCFWLPEGYATADLGWVSERYRNALSLLCTAELAAYDAHEQVVRIVDFLKHSKIQNPNHGKATVKLMSQVPDCAAKRIVLAELRDISYCSKAIDEGYPKLFRNPSVDSDESKMEIPLGNGIETPTPTPTPTETETETETDSSEPNGSALSDDDEKIEPPLADIEGDDPGKLIFDHGFPWLIQIYPDRKRDGLRSFLGKKRSQHGDEEVWSALQAAYQALQDGDVLDPLPWVTARLEARSQNDTLDPPTSLLRGGDEGMWRARLQERKAQGIWFKHYGPEPGEPDCQAPPDLVAEILGEQVA